MTVMLRAEGLEKAFTLHLQGGVRIPVLNETALELHAGECVALGGPSGAGKSTLMRCLFGNYRVDAGRIWVRHPPRKEPSPAGGRGLGEDGVTPRTSTASATLTPALCRQRAREQQEADFIDIARASPRTVLDIRRYTLGYVSQFLRVVPRVSALDVVAEAGTRDEAEALLTRLHIPRRLHALPPATFSGGEQQRVNLARGFIGGHPILLLDEPTASLDAANRDVVIEMIREAKMRGTAILGIFHDAAVREAVADRLFTVTPLQDAA